MFIITRKLEKVFITEFNLWKKTLDNLLKSFLIYVAINLVQFYKINNATRFVDILSTFKCHALTNTIISAQYGNN